MKIICTSFRRGVLFVALAMTAACTACGAQREVDDMRQDATGSEIDANEGYALDHDALLAMIERAKRGDIPAVRKLQSHYAFGSDAPTSQEDLDFWVKKGAELGDFDSMVNLAVKLASSEHRDCDTAKQWIERAKPLADSGPRAKMLLTAIDVVRQLGCKI